ncbi:MAG TPA: alanine--tRNA ligase [Verrucomicrobiae bacterium]|nr:alanine--tRNA ligase [Verrucomicrobiae bacterium]
MTGPETRQGFLDFFRGKGHTIVPSSSLMPDAPNLLFTNAGMNQFVPIFLGEHRPDVDRWPGVIPGLPTRAADTQKCIRAGGKHNDLEDVGLDTYHQTFFEMLGNWSFGDYFKQEAIAWAWELLVDRWSFPPDRLYATVYAPGPGDPAAFDQDAHDGWAPLFSRAGLDPKIHVVRGNKKDNFWMMGDTGPCGPCSEVHVDLTPDGATHGKLVNAGDPRCIEIWNLVFIQFNAAPDGTFAPLPARHVDTGMGFERVCSIVQGTRRFADFTSARISNYETDVFRPLIARVENLCGKRYTSTLPKPGSPGDQPQERIDVAMRVIADHIRTLSFGIADGILPSNEGRGYVLRRILRRAVRYGRRLDMHEPFLHRLVADVASQFGDVFPEIRARASAIGRTIAAEEENFGTTLDRGIELFRSESARLREGRADAAAPPQISGEFAFRLYDTYGFPRDLTELMAREQGLAVDVAGFDRLMADQRERARAAQKKEIIELADTEKLDAPPTRFEGYDHLEFNTRVLVARDRLLVTEASPCYAEMGGQVGDSGLAEIAGRKIAIKDTQRSPSGVFQHQLSEPITAPHGAPLRIAVDRSRRARIEAHHSGTHLLHWALRKVLGDTVGQKGSYVGPDRLRFDFSHPEAVGKDELAEIGRLVAEKIGATDTIQWYERAYDDVRGDRSILQFFGEKYGDRVRVVDIGGYSKELCGGTHARSTADIGFFKIISEGAIAAGVRRVEAVAGTAIIDHVDAERARQEERHAQLRKKRADVAALLALPAGAPPADAWAAFAAREDQLERLENEVREWEKARQKSAAAELHRHAAETAARLISEHGATGSIIAEIPGADGKTLQALADAIRPRFEGAIVLGGVSADRVALVASVPKAKAASLQAGKIISEIAPIVGGRGGGRPDFAQGGGTLPDKLPDALRRARELIG